MSDANLLGNEEQDLSNLSDEQLAEYNLEGDSPPPEDLPHGVEEGEAKEAGNEPDEEVDLQSQLEELRNELESTKQKLTHWRSVGNKHSNELGQLREVRNRLVARQEELRQNDLTRQLVEDPNSFRDSLREEGQIEAELHRLQEHEQRLEQQAVFEQNINFLQERAPDLPDNIDGICEMLAAYGDTPQQIQAFRMNPAQFPPHLVWTINEKYKTEMQLKELQSKHEEARKKQNGMFSNIEKAARRKPLSSASSGAAVGGGGFDLASISESDIANLSDDDIAKILSQAS